MVDLNTLIPPNSSLLLTNAIESIITERSRAWECLPAAIL